MEESFKLVSFKEFIARAIAQDFHAPSEEDWIEANEIMEGGQNFVHGKDFDTSIYNDLEFLEEYQYFMQDPEQWIAENEVDNFYQSIINVDELINEFLNQKS